MTSEISTFGFIGDSDTELPDLALELADLGLLIPVEALGDSVAALSRRLAWDQEVTRATGRWNGDTPLVEEYVPGDVIAQRMRFTSALLVSGFSAAQTASQQPETGEEASLVVGSRTRCEEVMVAQPDGIGLSDALEVLRADLASAREKAARQDVQFPIETLSVELKVGVTKSTDGKVGFKVPFVGAELGGSAGYGRESVQTITLVLGPPVDREGRPLKVASRTDERKE